MSRFSHAVATRNGLFLANPGESRRIADGRFFGMTMRAGNIYCFDSVDTPWSGQNSGTIVRFRLKNDAVERREVLFSGLHAGCHQIDFIDDSLFVVDTYNQRILEIGPSWNLAATHHPLPPAQIDADDPNYAHINSIYARGDHIFLMLHHRGKRPSEILHTDRTFRERGRIPLDGFACHDIVPLEDGQFLACDSHGGRLITDRGLSVPVDVQLTRGLSVGADVIVVGSSLFCGREHRLLIPGFVTYLDRALHRVGRLYIAASPTQIRRLDGQDFSLSNFAASAPAVLAQ